MSGENDLKRLRTSCICSKRSLIHGCGTGQCEKALATSIKFVLSEREVAFGQTSHSASRLLVRATATAFAKSSWPAERLFSSWYLECQIGCCCEGSPSAVVDSSPEKALVRNHLGYAWNGSALLERCQLCSTVNVRTATCTKRNDSNDMI